jgi:hypothetical protein
MEWVMAVMGVMAVIGGMAEMAMADITIMDATEARAIHRI